MSVRAGSSASGSFTEEDRRQAWVRGCPGDEAENVGYGLFPTSLCRRIAMMGVLLGCCLPQLLLLI